MSEEVRNTKPWTSRIRRLLLVSLLLVLSMGLATMVAVVVTARVLLPVAAAGIQGLLHLASASATAIVDGLTHGDSEQRLTILTQLKDSLSASKAPIADPQFKAWITPALEQCQEDGDPEVIALADEILQMLESGAESVTK